MTYQNNKNYFRNKIDWTKVHVALNNEEALIFVKKIITNHYKNIFHKNQHFVLDVVNKTFEELAKIKKNNLTIKDLKKIINIISKKIYSKNDIPIFFKIYYSYKSSLKPKYHFSLIKNDILGKTILDFGTGKGHLCKYLNKKGFNTISTDILDINKNSNFIKIDNVKDISTKIKRCDTTILVTVLHHISKKNIEKTLRELSIITDRLIIIEDIYDFSYFEKNIDAKYLNDKNIKKIIKLSEQSKKDSIRIIDFYGNVIAQGSIKMNLPFQFHTIEKWKNILRKNGFIVQKVELIGLPKVSLHGFFQAKIVCDSINKNIK